MKPIKGTHTMTFDDLPSPSIDLELEYSYYHDQGRYTGPPEHCYQEELEQYADLPTNWQKTVREAYKAAAEEAIKQIELEVDNLTSGDTIYGWVSDDYEPEPFDAW